MLAPGPIPEFPALSLGRFDFRSEAYNNCRVGSLSWNDFHGIRARNSESAFKRFHENDLRQWYRLQWYRLMVRSSAILKLDRHERVAITLLELTSDFGIKEYRGTLLKASFSHQDIADLVGASRPRVTEHLAQMEQVHLIIRQGRRLIVRVDKLGSALDNLALSTELFRKKHLASCYQATPRIARARIQRNLALVDR